MVLSVSGFFLIPLHRLSVAWPGANSTWAFFSSWLFLLATIPFLAECRGLRIPSVSESYTTAACRTPPRSVDRPIRDIVAAKTRRSPGCVQNPCHHALVSSWKRGVLVQKRRSEGFTELDEDKTPPSAWYIAPPPRVYAERWTSLVGSTTEASSPAKGWPNLAISIPADGPLVSRSWKPKRVPVPRLSALPSAGPRTPLWVRPALRTPRQQDASSPGLQASGRSIHKGSPC
ncbi:hypothetical protein B0H17DRAFT_583543 [Mycena rosella]|uniref:Uncharacterized protein n=1 Tax=Mycena rosella TaxID=1033263 RepID=A0AAD7GIH1_MYCRO|nr:hypothetical protein B0H17DRAFT_583543 [Mycena rosella]